MIIVYQSLESTGQTEFTASTAITGNNFKAATLSHLHRNGLQDIQTQTPTYNSHTGGYTLNTVNKSYATSQQSKQFSQNHRNLPTEAQSTDKLQDFLIGVIQAIKNSTMQKTISNSHLPYTRIPDLIVLGEIYGHELRNKWIDDYQVIGGYNPTGDARHRFTVLQHQDCKEKIEFITETTLPYNGNSIRCLKLRLQGWATAFVHVPNSIRSNGPEIVNYLAENGGNTNNKRGRAEPTIELDLIIGDTNQQSDNAFVGYLNQASGHPTWTSSIVDGTQQAVSVDGHNAHQLKGSNSTFSKHYDLAATNKSVVKVTSHNVNLVNNQPSVTTQLNTDHTGESPDFIFYGLTTKFYEPQGESHYYAYSDHNGVIVEILRSKEDTPTEPDSNKRRKQNPDEDA